VSYHNALGVQRRCHELQRRLDWYGTLSWRSRTDVAVGRHGKDTSDRKLLIANNGRMQNCKADVRENLSVEAEA